MVLTYLKFHVNLREVPLKPRNFFKHAMILANRRRAGISQAFVS